MGQIKAETPTYERNALANVEDQLKAKTDGYMSFRLSNVPTTVTAPCNNEAHNIPANHKATFSVHHCMWSFPFNTESSYSFSPSALSVQSISLLIHSF